MEAHTLSAAQAVADVRPKGIRGRPNVVLAMLTFVYVINFLDRQLLSILAKPIQDTLHVTDGQLGKIGGLYFAMFYCFIAIPVAWLADRTNRVAVLSVACAIWSAATIACGLARTYPQLVLARMTVVPYLPLGPAQLQSIARMKVEALAERVRTAHGYGLSVSDEVVQAIAERCQEVESGARNVDHILRGSVMPLVSDQILSAIADGVVPSGLRLVLDANGEIQCLKDV